MVGQIPMLGWRCLDSNPLFLPVRNSDAAISYFGSILAFCKCVFCHDCERIIQAFGPGIWAICTYWIDRFIITQSGMSSCKQRKI